MKKFKEYWNNIDWGYTLLCIVAAPFVIAFVIIMVVSTTPDLFDGILWLK